MKKNDHYCNIYLIRHGQTKWNVEKRMQGQKDSPLTKKGLEQAKTRAKDLSKINFSHIFSSDLMRAKRTAEIIANEHQLVVTTHKLLRERKYGRFEGRLGEEYREEMKDLLARKEELSHSQQYKFKISPDIESDEEIVDRFILFLREVSVAFSGMNIAAISHGGIMINFLDHLGHLQKNKIWVNNLSYAVIRSDGIDFKITKTDGLEEID